MHSQPASPNKSLISIIRNDEKNIISWTIICYLPVCLSPRINKHDFESKGKITFFFTHSYAMIPSLAINKLKDSSRSTFSLCMCLPGLEENLSLIVIWQAFCSVLMRPNSFNIHLPWLACLSHVPSWKKKKNQVYGRAGCSNFLKWNRVCWSVQYHNQNSGNVWPKPYAFFFTN